MQWWGHLLLFLYFSRREVWNSGFLFIWLAKAHYSFKWAFSLTEWSVGTIHCRYWLVGSVFWIGLIDLDHTECVDQTIRKQCFPHTLNPTQKKQQQASGSGALCDRCWLWKEDQWRPASRKASISLSFLLQEKPVSAFAARCISLLFNWNLCWWRNPVACLLLRWKYQLPLLSLFACISRGLPFLLDWGGGGCCDRASAGAGTVAQQRSFLPGSSLPPCARREAASSTTVSLVPTTPLQGRYRHASCRDRETTF